MNRAVSFLREQFETSLDQSCNDGEITHAQHDTLLSFEQSCDDAMFYALVVAGSLTYAVVEASVSL